MAPNLIFLKEITTCRNEVQHFQPRITRDIPAHTPFSSFPQRIQILCFDWSQTSVSNLAYYTNHINPATKQINHLELKLQQTLILTK